MKRSNNMKLLTSEELSKLKDIYRFELDESKENVVVVNNYYTRSTPHPISDNFTLNSKVRVITISKEAIKVWLELEQKYNLFEVQQVVYILQMMMQKVDTTLVEELLDKNILDRLES